MIHARRATTALALTGMTLLAAVAWFGVLAAERDATSSARAGARQAAVAAAVALSKGAETADDAAAVATVLEGVGRTQLIVRGPDGARIGGTAEVGPATVLTDVPGRPWTVEVVVPQADGLGLRRLISVIAGVAVLVLVSAGVALVLQLRHAARAAADLEDANRRFRDVAAADELTGLGNQARLVDDVTGLLSRGTRYGNGFALLAFDVDGAGADEASVRGVAHVVQGQARGADRCYRIGARIVTLLPEQGLGGASIAAERVRAAVETSGIGTVSVGVAAYVPWDDHFAEDVIGRAGVMARHSALDGGNRVTVAETSPEHPEQVGK